jgi:hypothetical protein
MLRRVALVAVLALLASGCGTVTGRPLSAWGDDKALGARVKTAIVGVRLRNLTHVNVDVYDRVVYLCGTVQDAEAKARTEEAARGVEGVRDLVSHLVAHETVAASASALPGAVLSRPAPSVLPGVVRLEGERAYDAADRVVATVYIVPMAELAQSPSDRFTASRPVDHVTVHAMQADAYVPVAHYLFVLWHRPEPVSPR